MVLIRFCLIGMLLVSAIPVFASDNYYFDDDDSISLTINEDYIVAKADDEAFTTWTSIINGNQALSGDFEPVPVADGFTLLAVNSGYSATTVAVDLRQTYGILFANNVYVDPAGEGNIYPTDQIYLHFKTTASDSQIDSLLDSYELQLVDSLYGDHYVRLVRSTRDTPDDVITTGNYLWRSGLLKMARATFALPYQKFNTPDDEYFSKQWYLLNDGSGGGTADADIDYEEARDYYMPTTPMKIGILDDGFESHEDFSRIAGGFNYVNGNSDIAPNQFSAHGMGCTGIITATDSNGTGVAGITKYNVSIIGQKIFGLCPPDSIPCTATEGMIALALDSCRLKSVTLISNSWGRACQSCYSTVINAAIDRCDSAGIVVVFSSGNCYGCSWVGDPARHPKVISVGATDRSDTKWDYSMYGQELDVVAPSGDVNLQGDIWTLDRMGTAGYNPSRMTCSPNDVDYDCQFGGTSAACPQVSGVVGLLLLRRPDLIGNTPQIRDIIAHSSEDKGASGWDQYYGWGRLNAARALLAVVRGDADNNGLITISDANYLINYIFAGGPAPVPHNLAGDADGNGIITISDASFIINYIFAGGPRPPISFSY